MLQTEDIFTKSLSRADPLEGTHLMSTVPVPKTEIDGVLCAFPESFTTQGHWRHMTRGVRERPQQTLSDHLGEGPTTAAAGRP